MMSHDHLGLTCLAFRAGIVRSVSNHNHIRIANPTHHHKHQTPNARHPPPNGKPVALFYMVILDVGLQNHSEMTVHNDHIKSRLRTSSVHFDVSDCANRTKLTVHDALENGWSIRRNMRKAGGFVWCIRTS